MRERFFRLLFLEKRRQALFHSPPPQLSPRAQAFVDRPISASLSPNPPHRPAAAATDQHGTAGGQVVNP